MSTSSSDQPLMSINDLADFLAKPKGTIYQWRKRGYGPRAYHVGGELRYRRSDVDQWLESTLEDHVGDVAS